MRKIPRVDTPFLLDPRLLPRTREGRAVAWDRVFGEQRPLRLEVGVGNSPFLIEVAKLEPEFSYLGFEYSKKRVMKFLRKVVGSGLENIRVVGENAVVALDGWIPAGELDHVFVNFPDPWPKRRHERKRFVQDEVIGPVTALLGRGGGISLRTDAALYARQMLRVLDGSPALENLAGEGNFAVEPRYPFPTAYELRYLAEARPIYYLEYVRRGSHVPG